jgi:thiamine kinase-like enzyme
VVIKIDKFAQLRPGKQVVGVMVAGGLLIGAYFVGEHRGEQALYERMLEVKREADLLEYRNEVKNVANAKREAERVERVAEAQRELAELKAQQAQQSLARELRALRYEASRAANAAEAANAARPLVSEIGRRVYGDPGNPATWR